MNEQHKKLVEDIVAKLADFLEDEDYKVLITEITKSMAYAFFVRRDLARLSDFLSTIRAGERPSRKEAGRMSGSVVGLAYLTASAARGGWTGMRKVEAALDRINAKQNAKRDQEKAARKEAEERIASMRNSMGKADTN
jgi:hypothetical protein